MSQERGRVHVRREGRLAWLVLDNPGRRNALSEAMWRSLPGLVRDLEADPSVCVILLRGEGATFSAGADIAEFAEVFAMAARAREYMGHFGRAQEAVAACSRPTLAVIAGPCVGGGCGLAMGCDFRFAAEDARLGVTPVKLGMIYSLADTRRLVQAVGFAAAKDLLFTGRLVESGEALSMGLVDRVVAADDLVEAAEAYAARIAAGAPGAVASTKRVMAMLKGEPPADEAEAERLFFAAIEGPEFAEGRDAFLAGRPPNFG